VLTAIVRFSIRFRGVVIALAALLVGYGLFTLARARLDVFPEFAPPQVQIQTEAPGLAADQVEALVTQPLESALNGVIGLATLRSRSMQGLSTIVLTFHDNTDIHRDRQAIAERLAAIGASLPQGMKAPSVLPLASSTSDIMNIGLTSSTRSPMELRTLSDWTIRPQLMNVPGVAGVAVFGGELKQLQIQVQPERLLRYGLSLKEVVEAARRATGVRGGGFIENDNQRIVIAPQGQALSAEQLGAAVLRYRDGAPIRLGDVARVSDAPAPPAGDALIDGKPAIVLVVAEQFQANTLAVTRAVEKVLKDFEPSLKAEGVTLYPALFRSANFIETAVGHLRAALLAGALLVIGVLFLFLFNVRTALISALAIPLSLLTAVVVLDYCGIGLNTMTLGGLAIALGEVVDDAIIDVENIFRRLRENRLLAQPLTVAQVVLNASVEVRGSVVYATFIVALVFVPALMLSGVTGRLFGPLAIAYIAAILASLVVALTLTPALAYALLGGHSAEVREPPPVRWLKQRYLRLLAGIERRAGATMVVVALFCALGIALLPFLKVAFLPPLREGHFTLHMKSAPGISLTQTLRLGSAVSTALLQISGVRSVAQRAGRASLVVDPAGVYSSEFEIDLVPLSAREQQRVLGQIRGSLTHFAGANFSVNTFLTERIEETVSGFTAPVVVNLFGTDLDLLDRKAQEVAAVLAAMPQTASVQLQAPQGNPQLNIRLRTDALRRWGIAPLDALETVQIAYEGAIVAQLYDGNRVFDVSVILDPALRRHPSQVAALPLLNPEGKTIRLGEVAEITQSIGRFLILHDGAQRLQSITAHPKGDVAAFVAEAKQRVAAQVSLPRGVYALFAGDAESRAQAQRELILHGVLAGAGVILLLFVALGSTRSLLLVFANLPFALVGGVVVVAALGEPLSVGTLVGFVTLFGITLRNSMMLLSHYDHLVQKEGMRWGRETAILGAQQRLAPILMTALVAGLGLLPLAVTSGAPGNEIEGPMALVILGGLVTSTILNLLVLPTLALRFGRFAPRPEIF